MAVYWAPQIQIYYIKKKKKSLVCACSMFSAGGLEVLLCGILMLGARLMYTSFFTLPVTMAEGKQENKMNCFKVL